MASIIQHKRTSVSGNLPTTSDIEVGELALNLADKKIYTRDGANNIIELAGTEASASADYIIEDVKNVSGGTLAAGTVVYQSGTAGQTLEVQAASNSSASTMPALGILTGALDDDEEGTAILIGKLIGMNTSSFTEGDTLYVGTSGALTATKPTGEANLIQNIGKVLKSHASSGSLMITGAGRSNATPNLNDGNIFIGNSSNEAVTGSLDTLVGAEGYIKDYTVTEGDVTAHQAALNIPDELTDLGITDGTDGQVLTTDGAGSFSFADDSSLFVRYADYEATLAQNTILTSNTSATAFDVSTFGGNGNRIAGTDSYTSSYSSSDFAIAAATTAASAPNTDTSGIQLTNNSGATVTDADVYLEFKVEITGTPSSSYIYFFAYTEPTNALTTFTQVFTGNLGNINSAGTYTMRSSFNSNQTNWTNGQTIYAALRDYSGDSFSIEIVEVNIYPTSANSTSELNTTTTGLVNFGTTPSSTTGLIGYHTEDSNTETDYTWVDIGANSQSLTPAGIISPSNSVIVTGSGSSALTSKRLPELVKGTGNSSVILGDASAAGDVSIAIGEEASSAGYADISLGYRAKATGIYSMALGFLADASYYRSGAIGYEASATAEGQLMLGHSSSWGGYTSIRVGNPSYSPSDNMDLATKKYVDDNAGSGGSSYIDVNSTGTAASATGTDSVAISASASASDYHAVALGASTTASGNRGVAIGSNAEASYAYSVALGAYSATTAVNQVMLGDAYIQSIRVGNSSYSPSDNMDLATKKYVDDNAGSGGSYADSDVDTHLNYSTATSGQLLSYNGSDYDWIDAGTPYSDSDVDTHLNYSTATSGQLLSYNGSDYGWIDAPSGGSSYLDVNSTGTAASATGTDAIAIGEGASATDQYGIAIGRNSSADEYINIAIGSSANNTGDRAMIIGNDTTCASFAGIALGSSSSVTGAYGCAIGYSATAGASEFVLGSDSYNSFLIGDSDYSPSVALSIATKGYVDAQAGASAYLSINSSAGGVTAGTGTNAIAIGKSANGGSGTGNVVVGHSATTGSGGEESRFGLYGSTNSYGSSSFGSRATATGERSTALGFSASSTHSYSIAIGNASTSTASNQFVLGNSSITDLRCQDTSITAVSDSRDKIEIEDLELGLGYVKDVTPVSFYKNNRSSYYTPVYSNEEMLENPELVQEYTFDQAAYEAGENKFERQEFGFIAQNVKEALPTEHQEARVAFSEDDPTYGHDVTRFTPGDMVPILWKAVQELSAKNDELEARLAALEANN